ncbi:hypothetical protein [Kitasatospora herbaricolor]|uniref:Uncharacterized protein n=1 Tax=Kitasatospora herbaricolor TaxID=68217 RepID=A0ABZ1WJC1_9ACTN|nr:hypothetical protein [Kitasatospora herbaricolor]
MQRSKEGGEIETLLNRLVRTPEFWAWAQKATVTLLGLLAMLIRFLAG